MGVSLLAYDCVVRAEGLNDNTVWQNWNFDWHGYPKEREMLGIKYHCIICVSTYFIWLIHGKKLFLNLVFPGKNLTSEHSFTKLYLFY
jgi:hypothetical protein